ncbi:hypothetical protein ILUMI_23565 [Ignelater luminosus]|uniref:Alanine--glyoxylate aminotransferase n=1 Tax=Ignelater luminosus TaxID=2038154 RepID=A0A8K0FZI7_IGNLU|nr:hypothetical protein ILUMI_23565 [Ignelater luminosus]
MILKKAYNMFFKLKNELTLAISTSGHGGMEAVMCNLLEPGDKVLITVNGIWGERASLMASRYGAQVCRIEAPLGSNFSLQEIEDALIKHQPSLLFVVQGESSTGVYQPIEGIGRICHKYNCLLAVDTVASLGGVPFYADRWEVDVVYSGSQKVLGAPPGLAPISFNKKAQQRIFSRKTPVKVFYWDMTILGDYWACFGNPRVYHHTISSTLLYGLREGLALIAEEGLENVINRHRMCALRLHNGLRDLGLEFLVEKESARLPTVNTIKVPTDVDWKTVTSYAMKYYFLEISGGLGPTVNKVFRIGLMGYNATNDKVDFALKILKEALEYARENKSSKL